MTLILCSALATASQPPATSTYPTATLGTGEKREDWTDDGWQQVCQLLINDTINFLQSDNRTMSDDDFDAAGVAMLTEVNRQTKIPIEVLYNVVTQFLSMAGLVSEE